MDITVVGSVALDSIKTPFGEITEGLGGSATHFSTAASFFTNINLVAVVGDDFPKKHFTFLKERGVNLNGLEVVEGLTFRWKGLYEYDLNTAHTLDTQLNVFRDFNPKLPEEYKKSKIVFLANIDPQLQLKVLEQTDSPNLIALDTMNFWIENKPTALKEVISKVDIVLMNDSEARELTKQYSLLEAAKSMLSWGPKEIIIKKGEHGVLMFTKDSHFAAPAFPLEVINDPTGAGDSFAGGFLGYLAKSEDFSEPSVRKAIVYGSVMASYNVEDFSCDRLARLNPEEIENRYKVFKTITNF